MAHTRRNMSRMNFRDEDGEKPVNLKLNDRESVCTWGSALKVRARIPRWRHVPHFKKTNVKQRTIIKGYQRTKSGYMT